ncbi:MAG: preprotein translocase subunit SecG [Flavobacteriales bacterium]|jgi:preprotein translocase subunit SecG
MENLILLGHLATAIIIVGLILLQQGKGAEMGASFGSGASQTLFGASGSGNFFARMTALFAAIFFVTSLSLAVLAKQASSVDGGLSIPELESVQLPVVNADLPVVESDLPVVDAELPAVEPDLPVVEEVGE